MKTVDDLSLQSRKNLGHQKTLKQFKNRGSRRNVRMVLRCHQLKNLSRQS